ncbi:hypothetical protein ACSBR1_035055 [Camellia fascicularis]
MKVWGKVTMSLTLTQLSLMVLQFIFSDQFEDDHIKLTITDINGSIEMWHNQLEVDRLDKVRFMLVHCCEKLSNVISSNLIQRLGRLEELKVWWCDSLETIFDLQGSVCEGSSITWFYDLKLMYLPKLTHIWKNVSQQTPRFKDLTSLEVERCDNLKYIFPISVVKVLVHLHYLRIGNSKRVEKIFTREDEEEDEEEGDHDDNDENYNDFSVQLENLPSLMCIGIPESLIHISKLRVDFCPKYRGNQLYFHANMLLLF